MPTIIATPGASDANSYVTVVEATAYLDARFNVGAWTAASADDKERALISATRLLTPLPFLGSRTTAAQSLAWPRTAAPDPDAPIGFSGLRDAGYLYYAQTVVPVRLKDATCELALEVLNAGTADLGTLDADANLTSKTVGPLSKSWAVGGKPQGLARFSFFRSLIAPLLGGARLVRS